MSCDHELHVANEWVRCSGKNTSYITKLDITDKNNVRLKWIVKEKHNRIYPQPSITNTWHTQPEPRVSCNHYLVDHCNSYLTTTCNCKLLGHHITHFNNIQSKFQIAVLLWWAYWIISGKGKSSWMNATMFYHQVVLTGQRVRQLHVIT